MIAPPDIAASEPGGTFMFSRAVLNAAAEIEAAETAIKAAVLAAGRAGDSARVVTLMERWQSLPACEVLGKGTPCSVDTPCLDVAVRGTEVP
jgi:hypothetical protein